MAEVSSGAYAISPRLHVGTRNVVDTELKHADCDFLFKLHLHVHCNPFEHSADGNLYENYVKRAIVLQGKTSNTSKESINEVSYLLRPLSLSVLHVQLDTCKTLHV